MKRDELLARLHEAVVRQVALDHQMEGIKRLYDACVLMADNPGADTHRQSLHTILDMKLDVASSIQVISKILAGSTE